MSVRAGSAVTARSAIQSAGGGLIPTSALHVRPIDWCAARAFVREHHYLHSTPRRDYGALLGVFNGADVMAPMIGAMIWMYPAAANRLRDGWKTLELRRMVILDITARNAESRVLAVAARYLHRTFDHIRFLLAYSDIEGMGHVGTIYKAAGWTLDGETTPISWANRPGRKNKGSTTRKLRWRKVLR